MLCYAMLAYAMFIHLYEGDVYGVETMPRGFGVQYGR